MGWRVMEVVCGFKRNDWTSWFGRISFEIYTILVASVSGWTTVCNATLRTDWHSYCEGTNQGVVVIFFSTCWVFHRMSRKSLDLQIVILFECTQCWNHKSANLFDSSVILSLVARCSSNVCLCFERAHPRIVHQAQRLGCCSSSS